MSQQGMAPHNGKRMVLLQPRLLDWLHRSREFRRTRIDGNDWRRLTPHTIQVRSPCCVEHLVVSNRLRISRYLTLHPHSSRRYSTTSSKSARSWEDGSLKTLTALSNIIVRRESRS
jgi:hypothetical protein